LPFVRYKHPGATTYKRGLYLFANKTLLSINNGLGMSVVPMRLGVPPEIIYYHLAKDEKIASKD
jgi:predicted MPP superfamily phosphohydrolase